MSDAGCILEYHIVIVLTWYGLKRIRYVDCAVSLVEPSVVPLYPLTGSHFHQHQPVARISSALHLLRGCHAVLRRERRLPVRPVARGHLEPRPWPRRLAHAWCLTHRVPSSSLCSVRPTLVENAERMLRSFARLTFDLPTKGRMDAK